VVQGAEMLVRGLETWDDPPGLRKRMKDLEHQGDQVTHDVYEQLNQTFITPIDREDIGKLAGALDDVLDFTYATVNHMVLYDIKEVAPPLLESARLLKEQCDNLAWAVGALRNLKDRDTLRKHLIEVNRIENAVDEITNRALADLFKPEHSHDVLHVLKMRDIYRYIETATDKGEDCADVLSDIAVKYA